MPSSLSAERTPAEEAAERPIRERQLAAYHMALEYVDGRRTLEIGCGEGIGASLLAEKAGSLVAIDYSDSALQVARSKYGAGSIEYKQMEVPPISFPDSFFDAVVCFQMIEHLEDPRALVTEIRRVLAEDGIGLIATVNKAETISDNPYHLHEFTAEEFYVLLKDQFSKVDIYGVFGDELFMKYWANNRKWVDSFMRLDFLNLSSHLPARIKQRLFDLASRLMRNRLKSGNPDLCEEITYKNFLFRQGEFQGCLDFLAICRKS